MEPKIASMNAPILELEGTWEEVIAHAPELVGQRVRLTVLSEDDVVEEQSATFCSPPSQSLQQAKTRVSDDIKRSIENTVAPNAHERLYTFNVYSSFQFQQTFTGSEVELDPGGDGTEFEPTETAMAVLREEVDEFLSEYYSVSDLRLECDSQTFVGSCSVGEIESIQSGN